MTKTQLKRVYERYLYILSKYGKRGLFDVYAVPSERKQAAYDACKQRCMYVNGYNMTVVGRNTCMFTVGYCFKDDKGEEQFVYETSCNTYTISVKELDSKYTGQ